MNGLSVLCEVVSLVNEWQLSLIVSVTAQFAKRIASLLHCCKIKMFC